MLEAIVIRPQVQYRAYGNRSGVENPVCWRAASVRFHVHCFTFMRARAQHLQSARRIQHKDRSPDCGESAVGSGPCSWQTLQTYPRPATLEAVLRSHLRRPVGRLQVSRLLLTHTHTTFTSFKGLAHTRRVNVPHRLAQ